MRNAQKILAGKPQGKILFGTFKRKWWWNTKMGQI